ncbi:MAG: hypothetical protein KDJ36_11185 [Hyphomicrobiaceae bacterium]|nr:hypothetical protein [Hyphomicrobiaceae bacterium]
MRFYIAALAAALLGALFAFPANAQTPPGVPRFPVTPARPQPKTVMISVSYQFFIDGSTGDMAEQARLSDDGRKHLYRMLARECEVLLETIAEECYVARANVSSQVQNYGRRRDGIRVSGSATYQITLKPTKRTPGDKPK